MKKIKIILLVLLMVLTMSSLLYAHQGRTDSNGGHYNRNTGEYHYHHGYPAHQHPNGICPYNTNHNNTNITKNNDYDNTTSSNQSDTSSKNITDSSDKYSIEEFIAYSIMALVFGFPTYVVIKEAIEYKKRP